MNNPAMNDIQRTVQELKDRQEILDCLVRYCRGMDRFDRDIIRSAYHPDAMDDHGEYVGGVEGFIDHYFAYHAHYQTKTIHNLGNHTCEIDGDTAHCETYWTFSSVNTQGPAYSRGTGRYIDRLEKRNGEWKIAARICVINGLDNESDPEGQMGDSLFVPSTRDRSDPSYMRPLRVDPARVNNKVFAPA